MLFIKPLGFLNPQFPGQSVRLVVFIPLSKSFPNTSPLHRISKPKLKDLISLYDPVVSPDKQSDKIAKRGYYYRGRFFIKRSLRSSEYITILKGNIYVLQLGRERLQNKAESLQFIRRVSNIPIPTIYSLFKVDSAYFLIMEYIDSVGISQLLEDQKKLIQPKINQYLNTLREIRSYKIGGPSRVIIPLYRVIDYIENNSQPQKLAKNLEYIFCHNDLSQHNIIINLEILKINTIIDQEYAGFFPYYFEAPFYKRLSLLAIIDSEPNDIPRLLQFLNPYSRLSESQTTYK